MFKEQRIKLAIIWFTFILELRTGLAVIWWFNCQPWSSLWKIRHDLQTFKLMSKKLGAIQRAYENKVDDLSKLMAAYEKADRRLKFLEKRSDDYSVVSFYFQCNGCTAYINRAARPDLLFQLKVINGELQSEAVQLCSECYLKASDENEQIITLLGLDKPQIRPFRNSHTSVYLNSPDDNLDEYRDQEEC